MKKKMFLRVLALVFALSLIGVIIFVSNAFIGNPITAYYANKAIENYVAEKYGHMDLIVEKARYNFIDTGYKAIAKSRTSIDTHFPIYYRSGSIRGDDYDAYVIGKLNTLIRLQNEFSRLATDLLSATMSNESIKARVQFEKDATQKLQLDMHFDKNLPIEMKIEISIDLGDNSLDAIAGVLKDANKILVENGFNFVTYDVAVDTDGVVVTVKDVSVTDIEGKNLLQILENSQKQDSN